MWPETLLLPSKISLSRRPQRTLNSRWGRPLLAVKAGEYARPPRQIRPSPPAPASAPSSFEIVSLLCCVGLEIKASCLLPRRAHVVQGWSAGLSLPHHRILSGKHFKSSAPHDCSVSAPWTPQRCRCPSPSSRLPVDPVSAYLWLSNQFLSCPGPSLLLATRQCSCRGGAERGSGD